MTEFIFLKYF